MNMKRFIIAIGVISIIIGPFAIALLPQAALAQSAQGGVIHSGCDIVDKYSTAIKINMTLPGITQTLENGDRVVKNLPCFIIGIYTYFAGIAGILATVMIMYGGIKYVTSFGNQQRVTEAKDTVFSAMTGLVLTLVSYTLLYWINPNLTSFNLDITAVDKIPGVVCDEDAVPEGGEGANLCGLFGKLNKIECRYEKCEQGHPTYLEEEYVHDTDGDFVCVQGTLEEPSRLADDSWKCMSYRKRCTRVNDNNEGVGAGIHLGLCTELTELGQGKCEWKDESWFNYKADGCYWLPVLKCKPGWARADCTECNNAGKKCPRFEVTTSDENSGPFQLPMEYFNKTVICNSNKEKDVYLFDINKFSKTVGGICCKQDDVYMCENGKYIFESL